MLNLIQQRNSDLTKAIRREMACATPDTPLREILRRAAEGPAPRFYVSFDRAIKAVSEVICGIPPCNDERRTAQWVELTKRVRTVLDNDSYLPLTAALARVLTTAEAPSFYISTSRALTIYHEQMRLAKALRASQQVADSPARRA